MLDLFGGGVSTGVVAVVDKELTLGVEDLGDGAWVYVGVL